MAASDHYENLKLRWTCYICHIPAPDHSLESLQNQDYKQKTEIFVDGDYSYWEEVQLQFSDGTSATVRLDKHTIDKLEGGDNELMETIRKNVVLATLPEVSAPKMVTVSSMPVESTPKVVTVGAPAGFIKASSVPVNSNFSKSVIGTSTNISRQSAYRAPPSCETKSGPSSSDISLTDCSDNSDVQESENVCESYTVWPREAILCLISLYKDYEEKMEDPRQRKKDIWRIITDELNSKGYKFTQNKVESRWRSLLRSHKETKTHNNQSGRKRKDFQYYEEIEEIVGKRHDLNPICIAGSGVTTHKKLKYSTRLCADKSGSSSNEDNSKMDDVATSNSDGEENHSNNDKQNQKRKPKSDTPKDTGQQLLKFLTEVEERRKKEQEDREKRRDERARERNRIMEQFLEVFKSFK